MTSVGGRKSHTSCKTLYTKSRSSGASNTSIDTSHLSIATNETNSYENTPSPLSSLASTSTVEHLPKDGQRILSSTLKRKSFVFLKIQKFIFVLKDDHSHVSIKRRSRFDKLFHHTQIVNRQYMITMTNILFQMQKEIYKLKRRTNRVEQFIIKQTKTVQPIIRIPRLTKGWRQKVCFHSSFRCSFNI